VLPTLAVLVGTTAVVVGALTVRWSLDRLVDHPDRYGQAWAIQVYALPEVWQVEGAKLAADPRVADIAVTQRGELTLPTPSGAEAQVSAIGLDGLSGPPAATVLRGRAPVGPGEVAFGSATLRSLDLDIGDRVGATGACGATGLAVVGEVSLPLLGQGGDADTGAMLAMATFDQLCAGDLLGELDSDTNLLVQLRDGVDAGAVLAEWRAAGLPADLRQVPGSITALQDIRQVPLIVAGLVGLLGLATAGYALLLGVRRRGHDLAVLRAIGLRPGEAAGVVRWQAATLAVVAILVGVPLGLVLGRVVWVAMAEPVHVVVRTDVAVVWLTVLAVALVGTSQVLSLWPGHRAACLRPAALLRSE
jgi:hypothetical protein